MVRKKEDRKKESTRKKVIGEQKASCYFCDKNQKPDYKNFKEIANFISDRGRIVTRSRTGVCSKHQKQMTKAVKRARHLALLPFIVRPE